MASNYPSLFKSRKIPIIDVGQYSKSLLRSDFIVIGEDIDD